MIRGAGDDRWSAPCPHAEPIAPKPVGKRARPRRRTRRAGARARRGRARDAENPRGSIARARRPEGFFAQNPDDERSRRQEDPADFAVVELIRRGGKTHQREPPTERRTGPGKGSPGASAARSRGVAPPARPAHRTAAERTCARARLPDRHRHRPWRPIFAREASGNDAARPRATPLTRRSYVTQFRATVSENERQERASVHPLLWWPRAMPEGFWTGDG